MLLNQKGATARYSYKRINAHEVPISFKHNNDYMLALTVLS